MNATATASKANTKLHDDFAALLEQSFAEQDLAEGSVIKGTVTAIEKDVAVIDAMKMETRVAAHRAGVLSRGTDVGGTVSIGDVLGKIDQA